MSAAGPGVTIVVSGAPGAGKSALARQLDEELWSGTSPIGGQWPVVTVGTTAPVDVAATIAAIAAASPGPLD